MCVRSLTHSRSLTCVHTMLTHKYTLTYLLLAKRNRDNVEKNVFEKVHIVLTK